jgi:hypothetical protein
MESVVEYSQVELRRRAQDPKLAFYHALDVIQGPWPAGEAAIAQDPETARQYAREVVGGPWPASEAKA